MRTSRTKVWMVMMFALCVGVLAFSPYAAAGLVDNGDGTVTDSDTGLMWANKARNSVTWDTAKGYCEGYNGGGRSGWRMPTVSELQAISSKRWPLIDVGGSDFVWSSTLRPSEPSWLGGQQSAVYDFRDKKVLWMLIVTTHAGTVSALPVRNAK